MSLDTTEVVTGESPTASIIVLHGLGADGSDFVPVCGELDLSQVGSVRYVLPSAPIRPVTINGGVTMRAWYDILGAQLDQNEDEAGLRESLALLEALIAREIARAVPPERIVLMGFSQGCAMTLLVGLRHAKRLAGLVGLSGYLPLSDKTALERSAANDQVPIFLAHGRDDSVVPLVTANAARDSLQALGYPVEWHEYPMQHAVCLEEIADLNRWLLKVLG